MRGGVGAGEVSTNESTGGASRIRTGGGAVLEIIFSIAVICLLYRNCFRIATWGWI